MFRVAICDDEQVICSQIEKIILNYADEIGEKIEVQVFYSGEELLRFLEDGPEFDLIFLDIELNLINGIEVSRQIREEMDNQILQIVYISGKDGYCRYMFEARPMNFLQKPFEQEDIIKAVRLAMKLTDKLGGSFVYKKGHEVCKRAVKDILYFASENREITMVTTDGEEVFYGKMDDVYGQVGKYRFMYIHKSYIVNYFYVVKFGYEDVTMSNLAVLPISQSRRREIREMQARFEKEEWK